MSNVKFLSKLLPAILLCSLVEGTLFANNPLLVTDESDRLYGRGVHAFFDHNYGEAITILSRAGKINTEDPRPFYFLGLAHLRKNESELAEQYFRKAAQLEHSGRALRNYAVSESLRRIQGEERMRIENIRAEERSNARIRDQQLREARYGVDTAVARETLLRTLPPATRVSLPTENLAALQEAEGFGDNPFGVRPVNPIRTPEEGIVAVQRQGTTPFGGVTANVAGEPEAPAVPTVAPASSRRTVPAVAEPQRRVFVNTDVVAPASATTVERNVVTEDQINVSIPGVPLPVPVSQDAARGAGRALGAWLSGRGNGR